MKKQTIVCSLMVGATLLANAQYGKTVCEGRTWDYYLDEVTADVASQSREVSGFHFSGTESVGDRDYAVFRDAEGNPLALMREEERKVYLFVPDKDNTTSPGHGMEVLDENRDPVTGDVVLYDFTLKTGERFRTVGFDDLNYRYGILIDCEVTYYSMFEFDGKDLAIQKFNLVSEPYQEDFEVIEGAGNVSGLLPFPQIANYTSGFNRSIYHLLRVSDADGGTLYENPTYIPASSPYGKTVCEGRTWDYYLDKAEWDNPGLSGLKTGYHFDGTMEVAGREYAVFRDGEGEPVALMREENRKVYLYLPGVDEKSLPGWGVRVSNGSGPMTGEVLVCDFSLQPADRFVSVGFDNKDGWSGAMFEFEVTSTSSFEFDGERYATLEFISPEYSDYWTFKVMEGVGNMKGLLPYPQMMIELTSPFTTNYYVVRVTDDNGGVLYEDEKFWAGVTAPAVSQEPVPIYDMLGRRVAEPIAGGIYVRDGRKVVWK